MRTASRLKDAQKKLGKSKVDMEKLVSVAEDTLATWEINADIPESVTEKLKKLVGEVKKDLANIRSLLAKHKSTKANVGTELNGIAAEMNELVAIADAHKSGFAKVKMLILD